MIRGVNSPKKAIKYLGVMLDWQGTYADHVKYVCKKADERVASLNKILPNIGCPREEKRRMLVGVVHSVILYAAPVWQSVVRIKKYAQMLISTQRKILIRAGCVIMCISPITLLMEERKTVHDRADGYTDRARKEIRNLTIDKWQEMWENNLDNSQLTKRLISDLRIWVKCRHRSTNYFLTQLLTNHGCFSTYLHRIKKKNDEVCFYCEAVDTAEHTLVNCPRWANERRELEVVVGGRITIENFMLCLMSSRRNWEVANNIVKCIMGTKEREEKNMNR
ncbi:uncharacterized protein LOC108909311 [Anoplophora glabripennis]|uniref:uncharacterized protein LOC108909311 n=1 Tax=Anoplophora glabripennis TaxID=217634 RepID=UPI000875524D|nr:uncharacterized protein LOC108909311 [Anoplophora glabripennis]